MLDTEWLDLAMSAGDMHQCRLVASVIDRRSRGGGLHLGVAGLSLGMRGARRRLIPDNTDAGYLSRIDLIFG